MNMMAVNIQKWIWKNRPWISFHGSLRTNASLVQSTFEKVKMSKHVELWKLKPASQSLPLALIFPWLSATTSAVQKYANLYHQRGMDVLVVRGTPKHFLWPPTAFKLANELEKCLGEIPSYQKFITHSFSVGSYIYTISQMNTRSGVPCFPSEKVIGQIYDSLVIGSTEKMADGLAISITDNELLQRTIKKLSMSYIQLTRKTQDIYYEVIQFSNENLLPVPSLFFYCENDVLCDVDYLKGFLALQREKHGDNIWDKCWPMSVHAGHLRFHRDEYLSTWNSFINKLDL